MKTSVPKNAYSYPVSRVPIGYGKSPEKRVHASKAVASKVVVLLCACVVMFTLIGYPLQGLIFEYLGISSSETSAVFKAFVFLLAVLALINSMSYSSPTGKFFLLNVFMFIYLGRLLYDYFYENRVEAELPMLWFLGTSLVPCLAVQQLDITKFNHDKFLKWLLLLGGFGSILALYMVSIGLSYNPWADKGFIEGRIGFRTLNPISLASFGGTVLQACIAVLFCKSFSLNWKILAMGFAIPSAYVLLIAESRGPMIGTALAIAFIFFRSPKHYVYLLLLLAPLIPLIDLAQERFKIFGAVAKFISGDFSSNGSNEARLIAQEVAISEFFENPLIGKNFASEKLEIGLFPHNIIVESAMALGLVGLVLLLVIILNVFKSFFAKVESSHVFFQICFIHHFIITMTSGALWGVSTFYVLIPLCIKISELRNRIPIKNHYQTDAIAKYVRMS